MSATRIRYLEACGEVAALLGDEGFKFRRSVPDARRCSGDWESTLLFESSTYNWEESITVRAHAMVSSSRVAQWQADSGAKFTYGGVYSTYLEYLHPFGAQRADWDVAGPGGNAAVNDIVDRVRTGLLPLQAALEQPRTFLECVDELALGHMPEHEVVDYLAAYGRSDDVGAYLRRLQDGMLWNNGQRRPRTILLAATRELALGLPVSGPYATSSGTALLDALDRAGQRSAILELPVEP